MLNAVAEFVTTQQGDSAEFIEKARALAFGIAQDYAAARLYVIRIDNWFGPKWLHFTGKSLGAFGVLSMGTLHVPPFVPRRVVSQRVFVGPSYEETVSMPPLHIECSSTVALQRRILHVDNDTAFIWFSGNSEAQGRGSVMVYLPAASDPKANDQYGLRSTGAFYVGFSQRAIGWEPAMLRGVSRGEVAHLEESGRG